MNFFYDFNEILRDIDEFFRDIEDIFRDFVVREDKKYKIETHLILTKASIVCLRDRFMIVVKGFMSLSMSIL